jgi:glycosyltransferase involved in cell wall biosynthesis
LNTSDGQRSWNNIIVIPCYNEAARLNRGAVVEFARRNTDTRLLFVDDCSVDDTLNQLRAVEAEIGPQIGVLSLPENRGKAEAVRAGMLAALAEDPRYVGFWDADLSTPLEAISEFCRVLEEQPAVVLVLGSRVRLLGRAIRRTPLRHYVGRVFATAASLALRLPVYDTQCGAKLFRASAVNGLFNDPFLSRWAFDVEVMARLLQREQQLSIDERIAQFYELPLQRWDDVPGSKVRAMDFPRSILDLLRIHKRYMRGSTS